MIQDGAFYSPGTFVEFLKVVSLFAHKSLKHFPSALLHPKSPQDSYQFYLRHFGHQTEPSSGQVDLDGGDGG